MRFLYQPIIPPRMGAMGFLSYRSESLVLCGRIEAANAITVAFGEKSGRFGAGASRLRQAWRAGVFFALRRSPNSNQLYGLLTTCGAGPPPRIRPVANLLASSALRSRHSPLTSILSP
jgi:hypothetical protein